MKKIKPLLVLAVILFAVTLIVPSVLVLPFSEEKVNGKLGEELKQPVEEAQSQEASADAAIDVAVFRAAKEVIEKVPLEQYLVGVVAAEMPADFEMEALKAQALTARTYYVKQMLTKEKIGLPEGADVSDTEFHQVYRSDAELQKSWGKDYSWKKKKILDAVKATSGQILTYKGEAITATFFSTSNGFTENSEDYWSNAFPYLRSVESPWDVGTEKFSSENIYTVKEFENRLGVKLGDAATIGKITERTAGKRVSKVDFNGKVLTGKDIREKLELKSSDFTWERKGNQIVVKTKGYGHGVGMSQYGANGMASEGKNYKQIVQHYYQGVEISSAAQSLSTITAKK
ncbi:MULTISPECIES: stage II sporulation protein D [unclassified Bacillus (in: firmicutes)]|uniref:stage II sporulation protein D n=1 Tax=unclassified Bacillus (in: firmicutes) TaxID=185979 RepID=UPI0008E3C032|nr:MULTISPECIES: stage II sporulation protein D [unclassified Bacillus (in: firmicutes)]SFB04077.1 stage II sporulation protein D [Bacillus sp. UNCCL13]SFQ88597.1 stage II sporulation protein D [Bacillus sp. cl95]